MQAWLLGRDVAGAALKSLKNTTTYFPRTCLPSGMRGFRGPPQGNPARLPGHGPAGPARDQTWVAWDTVTRPSPSVGPACKRRPRTAASPARLFLFEDMPGTQMTAARLAPFISQAFELDRQAARRVQVRTVDQLEMQVGLG